MFSSNCTVITKKNIVKIFDGKKRACLSANEGPGDSDKSSVTRLKKVAVKINFATSNPYRLGFVYRVSNLLSILKRDSDHPVKSKNAKFVYISRN